MNREEIKKILPHRDSMLLLDTVRKENDEAVGTLHIKGNEWFLKGHFPGSPVVPGVMLCEIMAQSACILLNNAMVDGKLPFYTGMDKIRFRSPVYPGDTFTARCRIIKSKGNFYFAEGKGYAGGRLCVQGEFSFAVADKRTDRNV